MSKEKFEREGQSNETAKAFRIARSVPELAREIKKEGVEAVVYEARAFRHREVLIKHRVLLDRILTTCLGELIGQKGTDSYSFNHVVVTARNLITKEPTLSFGDVNKLHVAVEAVIADMQEILLPFRTFKIRHTSVKQADNFAAVRNQDWHIDSGAGALHIVRVYSGPSTEYTLGGDKQKQTFKDGAISVHTEYAIHRAPYYGEDKPRFAIVMRLIYA